MVRDPNTLCSKPNNHQIIQLDYVGLILQIVVIVFCFCFFHRSTANGHQTFFQAHPRKERVASSNNNNMLRSQNGPSMK